MCENTRVRPTTAGAGVTLPTLQWARRLRPLHPHGWWLLAAIAIVPGYWHIGAAAALAQAPPPLRGPAVQEIRISLTEWALLPARVQVSADRPVRFWVTNAGALPHALTVEGAGVYAETETIGSGETARLEVRFTTPGTYDLFCPVGAGQHRLLGQEGSLSVVAGATTVLMPRTGQASAFDADLTELDPSVADGAAVDAPVIGD